MTDEIGHLPDKILYERFVEKHEPTQQQQFHALVEEVGELAEAYNTDASTSEIMEELADVVFIAYTLGYMEERAEYRSFDSDVRKTLEENLAKDTETDGNKITKSSGDS